MQVFAAYTGADFLLFYSGLLAFSLFASFWIAANLRPTGRRGALDDAEEIAVLGGGAQRHSEAVIADLYARGALDVAASQRFAVTRDRALPVSGSGRVLLARFNPFTYCDARRALAVEAERIAARLIRRGLLLRAGERARLRWLAAAPFIALLALGEYRRAAGAALGEPTGFLVMLMVLAAVLCVWRWASVPARTLAGEAALRALMQQSARVRRAPAAGEAALAVALFGTAVLIGTPWEPVNALRAGNGDSGGSGGGSSSDSDGGGGCGGGCGGCGG